MAIPYKNQSPRILRWPEVHELTGLCRSHVHALAAKDEFPKPIKLSGRASGWVETEVHAFIQDRIKVSRSSVLESEIEPELEPETEPV